MRDVEYLLALEDGTWTTTTVAVPLDTDEREALIAWAEANLCGQARYRKVVLFALYSLSQMEEEDAATEAPHAR